MNNDLVVDCLTMFSGIEDLKLDGRIFDSYLASRLTWLPSADEDSGMNLLPELSSLTIVGCSTTYLSIVELVHMVYSRARYSCNIPIDDDDDLQRRDSWVVQQQSKQWNEYSGPMDIWMIYLTDTKDWQDAPNCTMMQHLFSENQIIRHFVKEWCIYVFVDSEI